MVGGPVVHWGGAKFLRLLSLITALYPQYLSGDDVPPAREWASVGPVTVTWIGVCVAVFEDVSWLLVEQVFLQPFCAQHSRVQRQCGGCALLLKALCSATGAHCLVILPLPIEVETPSMHAFEASRSPVSRRRFEN